MPTYGPAVPWQACRPTDWSALERAADPVPGDPVAVLEVAAEYDELARAVTTAAAELRRVADAVDQRSAAVDAFRARAAATLSDLAPVAAHYEAGAQALQGYAAALQDGQAESLAALRRAEDARAREAAAGSQLDAAVASVAAQGVVPADTLLWDLPGQPPDADEGPHAAARVAARRAQAEATEARADLAAAVARCERAVDDVRAAALAAADALGVARQEQGLDDGLWEDSRAAVAGVTRWAGRLSAVLGVVALVLGATGVLAPVAAALGALALGLGAVALAGTLVQAVHGEAGAGDVGLAALGVVSGGTGRLVVGTVRLGRQAARAAVAREADLLARGLPAAVVPAVSVRSALAAAPRAARRLPGLLAADVVTGARALSPGARRARHVPPVRWSDSLVVQAYQGVRRVGRPLPRELLVRSDVAGQVRVANTLGGVRAGTTATSAEVDRRTLVADRAAGRERARVAAGSPTARPGPGHPPAQRAPTGTVGAGVRAAP